MLTPTESSLQARKAIALRSIEMMATGTADVFAEVTHRDFFNHEQRDEPPATRGPGPEAAFGVARWLRAAYADLRWDIHDVVAEGDLVAVRCTMSGRHTGDFVAYDVEGRVAEAFPPTRRRFTSSQSHWLRIRDGQAVEHWAQRDDYGMAHQLGWVPPTPGYLVRCALAKRRARRAADPPRRAQERPFAPWGGELTPVKAAALRAVDASSLDDGLREVERVVHHVAAEGDLVAVHATVTGEHVAAVAVRDADGGLDRVLPPTGRRFSVQETRWVRLDEARRAVEHWTDRDDLGMAQQLGWAPPSLRYLARMAVAKRQARG
ncbi:MAG TPA: ester cyclase [Solirubrobacteraceae bacterium]|jgi:predicted ester cyclase|nr:ester cyclase [Solirubrobacteraceae bacterium]